MGMLRFLAYSMAASRLVSSKLGSFHGRDDLQLRRQGHVGQLEAHLVVALAGGAVGDGVGLLAQAQATCALAISGRAMDVPSRYRCS